MPGDLYRTNMIERACKIIRSGQPVPTDIAMRLAAEGVDVERLEVVEEDAFIVERSFYFSGDPTFFNEDAEELPDGW